VRTYIEKETKERYYLKDKVEAASIEVHDALVKGHISGV
jgi:hypothetical protein